MRDLVITENITLDGVIDSAGGWFGAGDDPDVDLSDLLSALKEQREAADAFLVGRVTFEQIRSFWPLQTDDPAGISDYLGNVQKFVVSRTMSDPGWEPTTVLSGDLSEEIANLKKAPGKDIVCTGSITLVHSLVAAGLVDEYRLFVYPVTLGQGERLFAGAQHASQLCLIQSQQFRSGVVLLRYRSAGGARPVPLV